MVNHKSYSLFIKGDMWNNYLFLYAVLLCFISSSPIFAAENNRVEKPSVIANEINREEVIGIMEKVADWQIHNFGINKKGHELDWTNATLYIGMMELAKLNEEEKYLNWLTDIGKRYLWQPNKRMYMADDIVVSQMYLDMYRRTGDKRMLNPTMARTEWVVNHPSINSLCLNYTKFETLERWSWCDALFMAPPVYVMMFNITGDAKYLIFMDREFKATYDYLYDKEEKLFYRDCNFFDKSEANGEKVFWGRGNGWVLGGLVRILQELPEGSDYRKFYEDLFVEMSERVVELQGADGYWRASMLDPNSYPNPETSSSGFFVYALAYGLSSGLLDKDKYMTPLIRGWDALTKAVYPDGKLGWVQPAGEDPRQTTRDMTDVFGVGAFLLAGSEVCKLNH